MSAPPGGGGGGKKSWADVVSSSLPPAKARPASTPKPSGSAKAAQPCGDATPSVPDDAPSIPDPMARGYPLGFDSKEAFEECMQSLCQAAKDAGIRTSKVGVRGSAATYLSKNPRKKGQYFDSRAPGHKSDIDVFLVTDDYLTERPSRAQFFHPDKLRSYPAIDAWNREQSRKSGREVTAGAFRSTAPAMQEECITYDCKDC